MTAGAGNTFTGQSPFSIRHRLIRAVFGLVWALLAAWTPPPLNRWRLFVLGLFGAKLHPTARVYGQARIWYPANLTMGPQSVMGPGVQCYSMAPISIGARSIISQRAHLCAGTHDIRDPGFPLITRPVRIGDDVWICAEAFVGPGVTVHDKAVLGARGVAMRDLESGMVYGGNPAVKLKERNLRA